MISYQTALRCLLKHSMPLGTELVELRAAAGRFLAHAVRASIDLPRFDQSQVDGYGVRAADVRGASPRQPVRLRCAGLIRAGDWERRKLRPGDAYKILTGAPVAPGIEAIVMQEDCEEAGDNILVRRAVRPGQHMRYRGEEYRRGQVLLSAGALMTPPAMGLLAAIGHSHCWVYRRPRIGLLITGSELARPGAALRPGQVYESNSTSLRAALRTLGLGQIRVRRCRDQLRQINRALLDLARDCDVIVTVGGVSVGKFDLVRAAAEEVGVTPVFWRVAVKPGMPLFLGTWRQHRKIETGRKRAARSLCLIGLPGNPVSALVCFHQFVRPALLKMLGSPQPIGKLWPAVSEAGLTKKPGRLEWVRARLKPGYRQLKAKPTQGQSSHMLGGLAHANALLIFPARESKMASGANIRIQLLSWQPVDD
jgi:molybdopterin molybdotransferase